ncbi:MAG: hydrogen peroxide-inducible genes activator [Cytophagaceae bacterium]
MTLSQLEYVLAVDKHRHFVNAAEACFVTQPTLSMQIHKLEEELGILIFDRSKHPVIPTPEGAIVIKHAKQMIYEANLLKDELMNAKGVIEGDLKLGIIPTVAPYLIPLFVNSITRDYPGIILIIEELTTETILQRLRNDMLDAAILATPFSDSSIQVIPLYYEPFVVYMTASNPLYSKKILNSKDISQSRDILVLHEGHCMQEQVNMFCKKEAQNRSGIVYEAGSIETLRKMVDIRGGITFLPELAVFDLAEERMHQIRYFQDPQPAREISLITHRSFIKKNLLEVLSTVIKDSVPERMLKKTNKEIIQLQMRQ